MPADPTRPKAPSTPADSSDLILISALHPASYPQDPICDLRQDAPLETTANRLVPMACGPNVDQTGLLSSSGGSAGLCHVPGAARGLQKGRVNGVEPRT
jgi:hypothetical protein